MIRFGIIGRNFVVDWMLGAMAEVSGMQPVAVCSRSEATGREFAEKYGLPHVFTSVEEMAASDCIDAVYIASPNYCHFAHAEICLRAGKHVLCEKPATLTADETRKLVALAREKGVIFLEAMRFVFDDALDIIEKNLPRIGALRRAAVDFSQYSSRYDRIRAGEQGINAFTPTLGNAAIMDMGCYCVHGIVRLFGKPKSVKASAVKLDSGFEASGVVLMEYEGFTAEAIYSKVAQQVSPTTFLGEDGAIMLDNINRTKRVWLEMRKGDEEDLGYEEKLPINMTCVLREFAGYVASGEQPERRNQDSIWTMEVIDEARRQTGVTFAE